MNHRDSILLDVYQARRLAFRCEVKRGFETCGLRILFAVESEM